MRNLSSAPIQPTETPKAKLVVRIFHAGLAMAQGDEGIKDKTVLDIWGFTSAVEQAAKTAIKNAAVADFATVTESLTDGEKAYVADTLAKETGIPAHIVLTAAKRMVLPLVASIAQAYRVKELAREAVAEGAAYTKNHAEPEPEPAVADPPEQRRMGLGPEQK
jgi:hypothetical protein